MTRPRVVILGGGMGGLATAWELSQGAWRQQIGSITVYQRGGRLGGKGASSRGPNGRIEEHGLHVLLGYYDATFRLLRETYAELDRPRTDPASPIRTWREAVTPTGLVGLAERDGDRWSHFVTRFSTNEAVPGDPGAEDRPLRPLAVLSRALGLLFDFHRALEPEPAVYLSGSPRPRRSDASWVIRAGGLTVLAGLLATITQAGRLAGTLDQPTASAAARTLGDWRDGLRQVVASDPSARRTWHLVDLVVANVVGMLADGLVAGDRFDTIDHLDYRRWLATHGADPGTLDSPIVRGMYDLTFAYEDGDRSRPRFAAGLGLQLAFRMLFDFKGSIFWRMEAGTGEVVFAPLYQALRRRGVEFRFFHRLDDISPSADGSIATVHLTRQAELADGIDAYDPLIRVEGLPCWRSEPDLGQLRSDPGGDPESHSWPGPGTGQVVLEAGGNFDLAVLAVSVGMVEHAAPSLVAASPRWADMVGNVATVATRSAQLWLEPTEAKMGWNGPGGVTLSGLGDSFDTWASMSHLLPAEGWGPDGPRALAYLCGAMPDGEGEAFVHNSLIRFLDTEARALWPGAVGEDGFRWELLWDGENRVGQQRLDAQVVRANLDPSDRYVQSLPGSGRYRIAPGATGFSNLAIAGDWTACGLDAGCLEAAVRSGFQAARAVLAGGVATRAEEGAA